MFFFKRPSIVLDCFTSNSSVFEYAKPNYAIKFIPEWWKNIPKVDHNQFGSPPNMKTCAGFVDYFRTGFVMPLWSDLDTKIGPIGTDFYEWLFSNRRSRIESHDYEQMNNYLNSKEYVHLKLISPWYFSCNKNINWLWTSFAWHNLKNPNINILSGVISYKYQNATHTNILIRRSKEEQVIRFKFGLPIAHVIPLTDKKVSIKHHLISEQEYLKMNVRSDAITFVNKLHFMKKIKEGKND